MEGWDIITNTQQIKEIWEPKDSTSEVCYEDQRSNWMHKPESGFVNGEYGVLPSSAKFVSSVIIDLIHTLFIFLSDVP